MDPLRSAAWSVGSKPLGLFSEQVDQLGWKPAEPDLLQVVEVGGWAKDQDVREGDLLVEINGESVAQWRRSRGV